MALTRDTYTTLGSAAGVAMVLVSAAVWIVSAVSSGQADIAKELAATRELTSNQINELSGRLNDMNWELRALKSGAATGWSAVQHEAWALRLKLLNPTLTIPEER